VVDSLSLLVPGADAADGRGGAPDRVLVAGVVPAPRFGREAEVLAAARAVRAAGADLVDVSLPPSLLGPVARAGDVGPVVARVADGDEADVARRAGAAAVLVPPSAARAAGDASRGPTVVVVDEVGDMAAAGSAGLPLALDVSRRSGADAIGAEAAAIALGCRVVRTADVRRSRRVAEVMGAILAARRS
jgi:hypothetical protein